MVRSDRPLLRSPGWGAFVGVFIFIFYLLLTKAFHPGDQG